MNQLKAGVVLSYSSMALSYIVGIVYTPIMLRLLGQSEYGLYNLVASIVSYLGLLSFGFGSAYMRYYAAYKVKGQEESIARLNGIFLIIFSVIGLVAAVAGSILVCHIDAIFGAKLSGAEIDTAKILMGLMIFNLVISFLASVFNSFIIANEEYIFQKALQLFKIVINPFVVLPVLLMGYKSVGLVSVATLLTLVIETGNVIFCFKKLKMKLAFWPFDFALLKEMAVFSSFIFLNMIIDQINWNAALFILGVFHGTAAVAIYGLAAQLNTYYLSLSTAISSVFIPKVNKIVALTNDNRELTDLLTKVGRIQFMVLTLVCSGLVFLGLPFITLWAGEEYSNAYYIVILLVVPVTIPLIQNVGLEIQKAKNMHKFRSVVYLLIALVNIGISIPLGKYYGGVGCAISTAASLLVGNGLIMNWYYQERVGLDMKHYWKQIIKFGPSLLPPIALGTLISTFVDLYQIQAFLACGSLYVIVFCSSIWFLGMNQYEKGLICKPITKVFRNVRIDLG